MKKQHFTLIELLVVIAIIAILAGIRHAGKSNLCAMDGSVKAVRTTWFSSQSSWGLLDANRL